MEDKKDSFNLISNDKALVMNITQKYSNNKNIKLIGKVLYNIPKKTNILFYCIINNSCDINPFSSDINLRFEFTEDSVPYVTILNDFIKPTLNDGRNIFYCLTNKHQYIFKKNNLNELEKIFDELISGIQNFLLCLKENIQINVYIYYGEYEIGHIYQINDFMINKNTLKYFRIIQINGKVEEMKYIVITQLYFLLFEPDNEDMSLAKLEKFFFIKDIDFSFGEGILNKKNKKICELKLLNKEINVLFEIKYSLYSDEQENNNNNYEEFKNIILQKKAEIDLNKYKIIITNYKPLFTIEIKKSNKKTNKSIEYMYNDFKLYISYFEELYNYYKDFKEENIRQRVKTYLANLTYYCVDFISFYDSNPEEVKFYQSKMIKYLDNNNDI